MDKSLCRGAAAAWGQAALRLRLSRDQGPGTRRRGRLTLRHRSESCVGTSIACPAFGTNAICRRQMTIRDSIIHTGLHRPCGRFVPLCGTGRVDTRPYAGLAVVRRARGYAPLQGASAAWGQAALRLQFPVSDCLVGTPPHPSSGFRETPDATFPPRGEGSVGAPSPIA